MIRCKECSFEQEMTDQEWYNYGQAHCGIKGGDTVKVLREAGYNEKGWANYWTSPGMDSSVGKNLTVLRSTERRGFESSDGCCYPFFVLELVRKKEPESPLPQSILNIIERTAFSGWEKNTIKELVVEILKQK